MGARLEGKTANGVSPVCHGVCGASAVSTFLHVCNVLPGSTRSRAQWPAQATADEHLFDDQARNVRLNGL